jgi:hypothetical protein
LSQREGHSLGIEVGYGLVDCSVEGDAVGEGLVGEMVGLEVTPDWFDVVQFGRVLGQPL